MDIVVLCGGLSPERNVSISGGRRIAAALRSLGHRAALVDMYFGLEGYDGPLDAAFDLPLPPEAGVAPAEPELRTVARARKLRSGSLFGERALELCLAADLVFLALHGSCGEDGRVRAAFDLLGIHCTGSPYLGSAVAMDKRLTKLVARSVGVRTPEGVYIPRGGTPGAGTPRPPCVVKPVDSGSSLGVEIVSEAAALPGAVERAMHGASGVLVEEYIAGREIQISILGGKALPGIEICPGEGFYDYRSKYQPGAAREVTPAPLPPGAEERLAAAALAVYRALGLRSLARADFIFEGEEFCFLEINTLPGMTPTSLAPQEAAAAGMSYERLCERIIELAFEQE